MDLLYALQNFREAGPSWINTFFVLFSEGNIIAAPMVAACLFWCSGDKKIGRYVILVFALANAFNGVIKLIFCVYRPWILDPRLYPAPEAVAEATGYSFPSAHNTMLASILTAIAIAFPEKKWLRPFAVFAILLMMFARMYLGCHSLQDVIFGAAIGVAFAFLMRPLLKKPYESVLNNWRDVLLFLVLIAAGVLFIELKSYPMDFAADGSLLVDPELMKEDTYGAFGILAGIPIGNLLEIHYVRFEAPANKKTFWLRLVIGAILFGLIYAVILKKLMAGLDPSLGKFLRFFITLLFATAGYPALFKAAKGKL